MSEELRIALEAAVPLWMEELRGQPFERLQELAREAAQIVGEKGDIILYRGKKRGESAAAFNALARGIACLAFAPGGVRAFGCHWQARGSAT